ncbi:MAG: hypothetical protein U0894_01520 [Pirellulales bacterium]
MQNNLISKRHYANNRIEGINDAISYWIDKWEDLIDKNGTIASDFPFLNMHLLIKHIIDEITFNDFQNPNNKSYFQSQLKHLSSQDQASCELFKPDITLIQKEFNNPRLPYLLTLCRAIDSAFTSPAYINRLYSLTCTLLSKNDTSAPSLHTITMLTRFLIVELYLKGYSLETIRKLPSIVLSKSLTDNDLAQTLSEQLVTTKSPGDAPVTIDQRLALFRSFFTPTRKNHYVIFQIKGLKGDPIDITIANVNLYSPAKKTLLDATTHDPANGFDERFGAPKNACFLNSAVKLNEFDQNTSISLAIEQTERALDLLCAYIHPDIPFKINTDCFLIVSEDKTSIHSSFTRVPESDHAFHFFKSTDLSHNHDLFSKTFVDLSERHLFDNLNPDSIGLNLVNSLHWYRKAEESQFAEDKLLAYWIVLENLVNMERSESNSVLPANQKETKFSLIQAIVPKVYACHFLANATTYLYVDILNLLHSTENSKPMMELPQSIKELTGLNLKNGDMFDLKSFSANLDKLPNHIKNYALKERIEKVATLHRGKQPTCTLLNNHIKHSSDELLMLYRFRNRIVHNAHYDNRLLPIFTKSSREFAGTLIKSIIRDTFTSKSYRASDSLIRHVVAFDRVQEQLAREDDFNLLSWSDNYYAENRQY